MARFARPYCATEPVRTVPFFNLYDDIQITGVGRISYALEQKYVEKILLCSNSRIPR